MKTALPQRCVILGSMPIRSIWQLNRTQVSDFLCPQQEKKLAKAFKISEGTQYVLPPTDKYRQAARIN